MCTLRRCIVFAAALLFGCGVEVGNGQLETQTRSLSAAFTRIAVHNGIRADVGIGPPALSISGDSNLLELMETFVDGEALIVRVRPNLAVSTSLGLRANVVTEALVGIEATGGSTVKATASPAELFTVEASGGSPVTVQGIDGQRFKGVASGGSHIIGVGRAPDTELVGSGGSHLDMGELFSTDALLDGSGGSRLMVHSSRSVKGALSGGSTAIVFGSPAIRQVTLSGGSTVDWAE